MQKKRQDGVISKKSRYTSEVHKSANIETQKTAPTVQFEESMLGGKENLMTTPGYMATDMDLSKKKANNNNPGDVNKLRTNIKKINPYMIKSVKPKINGKGNSKSVEK